MDGWIYIYIAMYVFVCVYMHLSMYLSICVCTFLWIHYLYVSSGPFDINFERYQVRMHDEALAIAKFMDPLHRVVNYIPDSNRDDVLAKRHSFFYVNANLTSDEPNIISWRKK